MWRTLVCLLSIGGVATAAGCTDHGTYQVAWQFVGGEPAQTGCGAHGVDSVRVIGSNTAGDTENFSVLCTPGLATHSVVVGTWTLAVHQVDVRGVAIDPVDPPMTSIDVVKDQLQPPDPLVPLELTPRPECSDGIDNDGDGRVDLDDPECAGDPNGAME